MKKAKEKKKNSGREIILDLPDVTDIPGQENIRPPKITEMQDTTISSSDEEGDELFNDGSDFLDEDISVSTVSDEEKKILHDAAEYTSVEEEEELKEAVVDNKDDDNELLNENVTYKDLGAEDLDIPDDFEDDDDEELGKK
jgi:hypothetical protein